MPPETFNLVVIDVKPLHQLQPQESSRDDVVQAVVLQVQSDRVVKVGELVGEELGQRIAMQEELIEAGGGRAAMLQVGNASFLAVDVQHTFHLNA